MFGFGFWTVALAAALLVALIIVMAGGAIRYIPNDRIGIVEKKWALQGSIRQGFIALAGEAGFQPDVLRGGYHAFVPFQYRVHKLPLVTITQGQIGYLFARDGAALPPTQTLASNEAANDFENVRGFLAAGGQKGPQSKILREGTYAVNLARANGAAGGLVEMLLAMLVADKANGVARRPEP